MTSSTVPVRVLRLRRRAVRALAEAAPVPLVLRRVVVPELVDLVAVHVRHHRHVVLQGHFAQRRLLLLHLIERLRRLALAAASIVGELCG